MRQTICLLTLAVIVSLFSCSEPTLVGADLLDEDRVDIGFSDTLSLTGSSITNDSVRTYSPFVSSQLPDYLFGDFRDPLLGRSLASIYAQVYPQNNRPAFDENTIVDSIILVLPYDTERFYGKTTGEEFGIEVYQIAESLIAEEEYYSNQPIATEPVIAGSAQSVVSLDSLEFTDYVGTDTFSVKFPHYRISLDEAVGSLLTSLDSTIYESDSLFLDAFKGIHLRPSTENEGLLSFDLLSPNAGIYLYYHDDTEGLPRRFLYDFDIQATVRLSNFQHDYEGVLAGQLLNDASQEDTVLFVQGMSGLDARLEIPNASELKGLVVNKAELEVYVPDLEDDDDAFSPAPQLILTTPNDDGVLVAIEDIEIILSQRGDLSQLFGGIPIEDPTGGPTIYRMNISAHLQGIIDGNRENVLYITPFRKATTAARSVLYGAQHPQYGMKVKIAFTEI